MVVTVVYLPVNMLIILQEEDLSHLNRYIHFLEKEPILSVQKLSVKTDKKLTVNIPLLLFYSATCLSSGR